MAAPWLRRRRPARDSLRAQRRRVLHDRLAGLRRPPRRPARRRRRPCGSCGVRAHLQHGRRRRVPGAARRGAGLRQLLLRAARAAVSRGDHHAVRQCHARRPSRHRPVARALAHPVRVRHGRAGPRRTAGWSQLRDHRRGAAGVPRSRLAELPERVLDSRADGRRRVRRRRRPGVPEHRPSGVPDRRAGAALSAAGGVAGTHRAARRGARARARRQFVLHGHRAGVAHRGPARQLPAAVAGVPRAGRPGAAGAGADGGGGPAGGLREPGDAAPVARCRAATRAGRP